ncbi:hypothetical protein FB451DRAFT_1260834 [Mycena latifolia]|nr:hypothetical protein FB451DRAFT_1260834 [Mycena latifolia]
MARVGRARVGGAPLCGRRGLGGRVRRRAGRCVYRLDRPAARYGMAPLRVRGTCAALGRAHWASHAAARPHGRQARHVLYLRAPRRARHVRGDVADCGGGRARAELGWEPCCTTSAVHILTPPCPALLDSPGQLFSVDVYMPVDTYLAYIPLALDTLTLLPVGVLPCATLNRRRQNRKNAHHAGASSCCLAIGFRNGRTGLDDWRWIGMADPVVTNQRTNEDVVLAVAWSGLRF